MMLTSVLVDNVATLYCTYKSELLTASTNLFVDACGLHKCRVET